MLYLLYESPLGLALFKKKNYDEVASDTTQVMQAMKTQAKFTKMVKFQALTVFPNQETSVEVLKGLLEGQITPFLQEFLETNFPTGKKGRLLAVQDTRLAKNVSTNLGIKCTNSPVVFELYRGIRTHYESYIKDKIESNFVNLSQACIGMSHTLSRNLIKFDVNRNDKGIIQSYSLVDQMEKNLNTFSMRLKEWYGWHFPELSKVVPDNEVYARVVKYIGNRESLTEESIPELEELVTDGELAQRIFDLSQVTVGSDLTEVDETCLKAFGDYVVSHFDFKKRLQGFMKSKMDLVTPNLCTLIGESMGAKLLTHAGGLSNLSRLPASTIQILGAEKALFRALKKKGSTPKYGFIYNSTFISRAEGRDKGKISRFLANKCGLAARLDMHLIKPTNKFGEKMRDQVEERLQQLKAGGEVTRNEQVLQTVVDELVEDGFYVSNIAKKKPIKKTKKTADDDEDDEEEMVEEKPKKKKKKKNKKKKVEVEEEEEEEAAMVEEKPKKKKKKKKKKQADDN